MPRARRASSHGCCRCADRGAAVAAGTGRRYGAERPTTARRRSSAIAQMLKDDPWSNPAYARCRSRRGAVEDAARPEERLARELRSRQGAGQASTAPSPSCRATSPMPTGSWTSRPASCGAWRSCRASTRADAGEAPYSGGGQPAKDLEALATYVANKSSGMKIAAAARPSQGEGGAGARRGAVLPPRGPDGLRLRDLPCRRRASASACRACPSCPSRTRRARSWANGRPIACRRATS